MKNYRFTLIFDIHPNEDPAIYEDAVFESGCDDASFLIGKTGSMGFIFNRDSDSAKAAIESAIENVVSAVPHAQLCRAEPDLVNLKEMAELAGTTKQNLRKYASGEVAKVLDRFPTPRIAGRADYWHGDELARWLSNKTGITVEDEVLDTLVQARRLNVEIEMKGCG